MNEPFDVPPRAGTFFDSLQGDRLARATRLEQAWRDYVIIVRRMQHAMTASGWLPADIEASTGIRPGPLLALKRAVWTRHVFDWALHCSARPSALLKPDVDMQTAVKRAHRRMAPSIRVAQWRIATAVLRRRGRLGFTDRDLAVLTQLPVNVITRLLRAPDSTSGCGPMSMPLLNLLCVTHGVGLDLHAVVSRPVTGEPAPESGRTHKI